MWVSWCCSSLLQAVVQVDEAGTEAAAVTSVVTLTSAFNPTTPPPLVSEDASRAQQIVVYQQTYQLLLATKLQLNTCAVLSLAAAFCVATGV